MTVPTYIASALQLVEPFSTTSVAEAADATGFADEVFGISGEEFAAALEVSDFTHAVCPSPALLNDWAYLEIARGIDSRFQAVVVPSMPSGPPPTAAGKFLVESWAANETLVTDRVLQGNLLLTGEEQTASSWDFYDDFVKAWVIAAAAFQNLPTTKPKWLGVTSIQIAADSRLTKSDFPQLKFTDLLLESISETKAKWRFLALYRVFEHGYLSEILLKIQREFFRSPKETLDACRTSVESEVRQFNALCESTGIEAYFERFLDSFEQSKTAHNRYAFALDRSVSNDGQLSQLQGKAAKGVLVCYKIRCSIVHSGLSAPMFEAYPDAGECLEAILGDLETAVLAFLGVTVS
jgi:hypothetical protein